VRKGVSSIEYMQNLIRFNLKNSNVRHYRSSNEESFKRSLIDWTRFYETQRRESSEKVTMQYGVR